MLRGHREPVTVLAFSPDGKVLASGSTDQTVRLWDLHNPQGEPIVLSEHNTRVKVIAFSPDGKYVASGAQNGTLLFWLRTAMLSEAVCQRVQRNLTADRMESVCGRRRQLRTHLSRVTGRGEGKLGSWEGGKRGGGRAEDGKLGRGEGGN